MGTPRYVAPEQAVGDPIGPPSDLFALGLVVAEWLTGRVRLDGERHADVMQKLLDGSPIELSDCPPRWQMWLQNCLYKMPDRRFQSARDAVNALEDLVVNYQPTPKFDENRFISPPPTKSDFMARSGPLELDLDRVRQTGHPHAPLVQNTPAGAAPSYQPTPVPHVDVMSARREPSIRETLPARPVRKERLTWIDYAWAWAIFMFIAVLAIMGLNWALKHI